MNPFQAFVMCSLLLTTATVVAAANPAAEEMEAAARNFLAMLSPQQRTAAVFPLQDGERQNWHFIPKPRRGLPFKEMTPGQRHLAHALIATGLSDRGYVKAVTIMSLDDVLKELEQGKGPVRDPDLYYLSVFGEPGGHDPWGWRVEGHHLSLNFTLVDGNVVSVTPSFFGSNPAQVLEGPRKGLRVLASEEDLGRQLLKSLTNDQKKTAIIATESPREIVTGNSRKAELGPPQGLPVASMDESQTRLVIELVRDYVFRHRPAIAEQDLQKIEKAGWKKIYFAWAGGAEPGQGHYYRLQGPTFVMEFDNTQNDANHIHTVWRDFESDFGLDLLRLHYDQTPHPK